MGKSPSRVAGCGWYRRARAWCRRRHRGRSGPCGGVPASRPSGSGAFSVWRRHCGWDWGPAVVGSDSDAGCGAVPISMSDLGRRVADRLTVPVPDVAREAGMCAAGDPHPEPVAGGEPVRGRAHGHRDARAALAPPRTRPATRSPRFGFAKPDDDSGRAWRVRVGDGHCAGTVHLAQVEGRSRSVTPWSGMERPASRRQPSSRSSSRRTPAIPAPTPPGGQRLRQAGMISP